MLSAVIIESRSLTARPTGCETRRQVNGKNAPPLETWIGMNTGFLMCLAVAFCVLQWWRRGWRKESWRTKYGGPGREPMIPRRRLTRRSERLDIINVELDDITSLFCLETNTRHHTTPPRLRTRLPWPPHDQSRFRKTTPVPYYRFSPSTFLQAPTASSPLPARAHSMGVCASCLGLGRRPSDSEVRDTLPHCDALA
jgi:hypothetical protein